MNDLICTLVGIGALAKDSIVTARCSTTNRFGMISYSTDEYVLQEITNDKRGLALKLRQSNGNHEIIAVSDDITAIDGMSVDRYADIYNINSDGTVRSTGRKRGRKPKIR